MTSQREAGREPLRRQSLPESDLIAYSSRMKILVSVHAGAKASTDHIEKFDVDLPAMPRIGEEIAVLFDDAAMAYRVFDVSWEVVRSDADARTPLVRVTAAK